MSEEPMADDVLVFDEAGQEVAVDELEHGDTVFDSEGNEYVFVEDGDDDDVEKAFAVGALGEATRAGSALEHFAGAPKKFGAKEQFAHGFKTKFKGNPGSQSMAYNMGSNIGRNKKKYAAAAGITGGATLAGGALMARDKYSKSLGDSIIEELSKAVTDADRDEVIAKALNEVEVYKAQAAEALAWAEQEHDTRVTEAFISKAAEYNLPVSPEVLGPILKAVAEVLTEEELDVIDEIFNAVGDALYEEIGYIGESSNSSVMDQVDAMANEYVGKSDFSHAQMTTAMFSENPSAYDAYISEMGR
jgi:hypothetical protein